MADQFRIFLDDDGSLTWRYVDLFCFLINAVTRSYVKMRNEGVTCKLKYRKLMPSLVRIVSPGS